MRGVDPRAALGALAARASRAVRDGHRLAWLGFVFACLFSPVAIAFDAGWLLPVPAAFGAAPPSPVTTTVGAGLSGRVSSHDPGGLSQRVPSPVDTLSVSQDLQGDRGSFIRVSLELANHQGLKAVQADLAFDPAVIGFSAALLSGRAGFMTLGTAVVHQDTLRVLFYCSGPDSLAAGRGEIAALDFLLLGGAGTQSPLHLVGIKLVDPSGGSVVTTTRDGVIHVLNGGGPTVTLLAPNGGDSWTSGETRTVRWQASGGDVPANQLQIKVEYSLDSGSTWSPIANLPSNPDSVAWTVPDVESSTARVRVTANDGAHLLWDVSDHDFTLVSANPLTLSLSVMCNPGNTRILQIFVTADRALEALPAVRAGSTRVVMTQVSGSNVYQGSIFLATSGPSVKVSASGRAGSAVRSVETVVTF